MLGKVFKEQVRKSLRASMVIKAPGQDEFHFPFIKAAWKFLMGDFMEMFNEHRQAKLKIAELYVYCSRS